MLIEKSKDDIFYAEFKEPKIPIATFTKALTKKAKMDFVLDHNYGEEFIAIYKHYRNDMNISNVMKMLGKMEEKFHNYDNAKFEVKRSYE